MYLIVGANGYLGHYMIKNILELTNENILAFDLNPPEDEKRENIEWIKGDITSIEDVEALNQRVRDENSLNIIYLAAYHHPDKVQENPKLAWNINIISLAKFLNIVENVNCLFYASTDTVYGEGSRDVKFKEADKTNPVNLYGVHKATAETLVNAYGYNVVRYPFLIGPSIVPHKKHFYDIIAETISRGETMDMFVDSYRSSLDFNQAAGLLIRLMESYRPDMKKIINIAGDQCLSKYDVGVMIAEKIGVDTGLIKPIATVSDNEIFVAKRSQTALLDNSYLKKYLSCESVLIQI